MTASLLGASFEAFVHDDEMLSGIYRALRGIEVSDENIGFDAICSTILGEGHFLGGAQTHSAMERDYFYPSIADRSDPRTWSDAGGPDSWSRARARAKDILASYHPAYLTDDQISAIKQKLKIIE